MVSIWLRDPNRILLSELLIVFILSLPTDIGNIEMKRVLILSVDTPSEETRRRRDEGLMFPDICLMTGLASVGLSLLFIALRPGDRQF